MDFAVFLANVYPPFFSYIQVYRVSILLNLRTYYLKGFEDVPYLSWTWSLPAYVMLALLTLLLEEREGNITYQLDFPFNCLVFSLA